MHNHNSFSALVEVHKSPGNCSFCLHEAVSLTNYKSLFCYYFFHTTSFNIAIDLARTIHTWEQLKKERDSTVIGKHALCLLISQTHCTIPSLVCRYVDNDCLSVFTVLNCSWRYSLFFCGGLKGMPSNGSDIIRMYVLVGVEMALLKKVCHYGRGLWCLLCLNYAQCYRSPVTYRSSCRTLSCFSVHLPWW